MIEEYKLSFYNLDFMYNNYLYLFNTKNCGLIKLNKKNMKIFEKYKNKSFFKKDIPKVMFNNLYKNDFILKKEKDELYLEKVKKKIVEKDKDNFNILFTITFNCNFECPYCYENNINVTMSDKTIDKSLNYIEKKAFQYNKLTIVWFGGEPLLEFEKIKLLTPKIINICEENNCEYEFKIITNGYLLNKKIIKEFKKLNICYVQITLDGPKKIHNKTRKLKNGKGSFNKIVSNLNYIKEQEIKSPKINIRINLHKDNIKFLDELLEQIEFISESKNIYASFAKVSPNSKEDLGKFFTDEEFAGKQIELYEKLEKKRFIKLKRPFYLPNPTYTASCTAIKKNTMIIGPKGYLYKCYKNILKNNKEIGRLGKEGYEEYNFHNYGKWINYEPFKDKLCKECKFLPLCYGNCVYNRKITDNEVGCKEIKYNLEEKLKRYLDKYIN